MSLENNNSEQENIKISRKNKLLALLILLFTSGAGFPLCITTVEQMHVRDEIRKVGICLKREALKQSAPGKENSAYETLLDVDEGHAKTDCGYRNLSLEQKLALFTDLSKDNLQICFLNTLTAVMDVLLNAPEIDFRDYLKNWGIEGNCFVKDISFKDRELLWNSCKDVVLQNMIDNGYNVVLIEAKLNSMDLSLRDVVLGVLVKMRQPKILDSF